MKCTLRMLIQNGFLLALLTFAAHAQATRTWVSGVGDDANPCSRTAPCKTFAGAISKTATAGEINCIDPGGYGAVTITKSITIDCTGVQAGVLVSGSNGIVVNDLGANSAVVTLRNLDINGSRNSPTGVELVSGVILRMENVKVYGFTQSCVTVNANSFALLAVNDSSLSECGTNGVSVFSSGSNVVYGQLSNVKISDATNAINAQNGSRLVLRNVEILSGAVGIIETNSSTAGVQVAMTGGTITLCGTAVQAIAGGSVGVTGVTFYGNGTVFNPSGGSIASAGDNPQIFNGAAGTANGGTIPKI